MSLFSEAEPPSDDGDSGISKLVILALIVLAIGIGGYFYLVRGPSPEEEPTPAPVAETPTPKPAPEPEPEPAPVRSASVATGGLDINSNVADASVYLDGDPVGQVPVRLEELKAKSYTLRVTADGYEPYESTVRVSAGKTTSWVADLALPPASLVVTSDIPGATVFLDRNYVGTTPATVSKLDSGTHQLTVSAEGYDMYAETVEVESGKKEVHVSFKQASVSLNESIQVVHKHRMGSCEGTLMATQAGIRYETTNKNDAFDVSFAQLERFEVDYIDKNLKIKPRGSRNFNFTEKTGNSDPLYVFHQRVQAFRDKGGN